MSDLQKLLAQPQVGAFIKGEKQINSLFSTWMNFSDPVKVKIFLDHVRADEEMPLIVSEIKKFQQPLFQGDQQIDDLSKVTSMLPNLKKFVAIIYTKLTVGFGDHWDEDIFQNRIHPRDHALIRAFSLDGELYNWDEEIALLHPFIKSTWAGPADWPWVAETVWIESLNHWLLIVDKYLQTREVVMTDANNFKDSLMQRLEQDKLVAVISKKFALNKDQLLVMCGVQNDADLLSLIPMIQQELPELFTDEKLRATVVDGVLVWLKDWGGAHDTRGWDIRVSRYYVHALYQGKHLVKKLPYYYEYQDYPGGQTYWYKEYKLQSIVRIALDQENIHVIATNDLKEDLDITLADSRIIGSTVRNQLAVEKSIKDLESWWPSHANKNFIPINGPQKGNGLATYPYTIVSQELQGMYFIAAVKVIDMEHYVDYDTPNGQQAIGCQYVVSIFRFNPETGQRTEIYSRTSDRNEHFRTHLDIVIARQSAGDKLLFGVQPEIYQSDKKIGVQFKLRTGQDQWTNIKFETYL